MCHTACTEPQCLYSIAIPLLPSVPVQRCFLRLLLELMFGDPCQCWFAAAICLRPWRLPMILVCRRNVGTAALDTSNAVAVLVTDCTANRAPTVCPLRIYDNDPIVQYFNTKCR